MRWRSDGAGTATLVLPADTLETVQALYVRPTSGYSPTRVQGATLPPNESGQAVVTVRTVGEDFEGFPGKPLTGWGAQAMYLTLLPPTFRGHGTTIALLDAGNDADHPAPQGHRHRWPRPRGR